MQSICQFMLSLQKMLILSMFILLVNFTFHVPGLNDPLSMLKYYEFIENPTNWTYFPSGFSQLTFHALGRDFLLDLRPIKSHISAKLKISFSDTDPFNVNQINLPDVYGGSMLGNPNSSVLVQIDTKKQISATIYFLDSLVILEPLSFYNGFRDSDKLLVYWFHDILNQNMSMQHDIFPRKKVMLNPYADKISRVSRNAIKRKDKLLCGIQFIADYNFFANVGGFDHAKTVDVIVKAFNRVNEIFLSTNFSDEGDDSETEYGFYLKGISIESVNRNENQGVSSAKELLLTFSKREFQGNACLIHLFTFSPNLNGVLGMSWMASPALQHMGGICSPEAILNSHVLMASNTGFTSYSDSDGEQILSSLAELVTAHELGHSWGAPHDPASPECDPPAEHGGRYLMYTFAVPGYSPNNYRFSPCSRRAMRRCLQTKAPLCFEEAALVQNYECGNSRVDSGEECDTGGSRNPEDNCCTRSCKLKPGAQCSPFNHECCTPTCQLAPKGTLCAETSVLTPCLNSGVCNGKSAVCPGPSPSSYPKRCHEHGQCVGGLCAPFCSSLRLSTCICNEPEASCLICCAFNVQVGSESRSLCQPMVIQPSMNELHNISASTLLQRSDWQLFRLEDAGVQVNTSNVYFLSFRKISRQLPLVSINKPWVNLSTLELENNRPCTFGFCKEGVCLAAKAKHVERLWPLITYLSENTIGTLIWDNLVSVVIFLTLCLWIPLSLLIGYNDAKLLEAHQKSLQQAVTPYCP